MHAYCSRWASLAVGAVLIGLGIWLLFTPPNTLLSITVFMALGMLLSGAADIVLFFSRRGKEPPVWLLASGILSALLGAWLAFFPSGQVAMATVLPFLSSLWMLMIGVSRLAGACMLGWLRYRGWGWMLLLGVLGMLGGFFFLFHPMIQALTLSLMLGGAFLWNGVAFIALFPVRGR